MIDADFSHLSILVVEDSEINVLLIKRFLNTWKVKAEFVKNGIEALELLSTSYSRYDMVLLDIYLPDMNGLEIIMKLREEHNLSSHQLPVIAVTSSLEPKVKELVETNYFNDLVFKPFSEEDIFSILSKL